MSDIMSRLKLILFLLNACGALILLMVAFKTQRTPESQFRYQRFSRDGYQDKQLSWPLNKRARNVVIRTSQGKDFIYSAFEKRAGGRNLILVNGWHDEKVSTNVSYYCCFILKSRRIVHETVRKLEKFYVHSYARLKGAQFQCAANDDITQNIVAVSIVGIDFTITQKHIATTDRHLNQSQESHSKNEQACPNDKQFYALIERASFDSTTGLFDDRLRVLGNQDTADRYRPRKKSGWVNRTLANYRFAICAKIVYGNPNLDLMIEWMEYNRIHGVSKVVIYAYTDLSKTTINVLQHYQQIGFLDVLPFDLPLKDTVKREVGGKTDQWWDDEQVAVYDCQERLSNYTYVGVIDFDEFIIPQQDKSYQELFERLHAKFPHAAVFVFQPKLHILPYRNGSSADRQTEDVLIIEQKIGTMKDTRKSYKNVFLSERVNPGLVWTHDILVPLEQINLVDDSMALFYHFRHPRKEWKTSKVPDSVDAKATSGDKKLLEHLDNSLRKRIRDAKHLLLGAAK